MWKQPTWNTLTLSDDNASCGWEKQIKTVYELAHEWISTHNCAAVYIFWCGNYRGTPLNTKIWIHSHIYTGWKMFYGMQLSISVLNALQDAWCLWVITHPMSSVQLLHWQGLTSKNTHTHISCCMYSQSAFPRVFLKFRVLGISNIDFPVILSHIKPY